MKHDIEYLKKILLNSRFDKINIIFDYLAEIKIYLRGVGLKYLFISFSSNRPFVSIADRPFPLRLKSRTSFSKAIKNVAEGMLFSSLVYNNGVLKIRLERRMPVKAVYLSVGINKFFLENEEGEKLYSYDGFLGNEIDDSDKIKNSNDVEYSNDSLLLELQISIYEEIRSKIGKVYRKKFKKTQKTVAKIKSDVDKFDNFEGQFKKGDILKSQLYNVKRGMETVELNDWSSQDNATVIVKLNPALSPADNLALIYKKASKSKRGLNKAKARLATLKKELDAHEVSLKRLESSSHEQLNLLFSQEQKLFFKVKKVKKSRDKSKEAKSYWAFEYEDYILYVGKNAKGNEFLSFKKANGNDLWFHAYNYPGSHVLLKRKSKHYKFVDSDVSIAATFALFYSKAPCPGKEEVVYTEAKNLGRIPSAPPGTVRRSSGKVVQIFVNDEVVAKIKSQVV